MASEDKNSFPVGFDILPPKLKKRKVSCDSEICAICQESSVEKAIRASEQRRDEEVRARLVNYDTNTGVHWHSNCYASYTSEQNIRYTTRSDTLSRQAFRTNMAPSLARKRLIKRVEILLMCVHSRPVEASN